MRSRRTASRSIASAELLHAVVDAVAAAEDEAAALHAGLTVAVAGLEADCGAVVRNGAVLAAAGPADRVPDAGRETAAPMEGGRLVVARRRPLDDGEVALVHEIAAVLDTTSRLAGRLATERAARARAEATASDLARRQRLFEDLSAIQRSISHRAPLPEILDAQAVGRAVLRDACARAVAEHRTVAVRLSASELADPTLPADVAATLAETGLPATSLVLGVAETVLMQTPDAAIAPLAELKALGVRLAVDDFGVGPSSLRYLPRLGVDMLKLAPAFADAISDGEDTVLARAVLDLAARLGLQVIA